MISKLALAAASSSIVVLATPAVSLGVLKTAYSTVGKTKCFQCAPGLLPGLYLPCEDCPRGAYVPVPSLDLAIPLKK